MLSFKTINADSVNASVMSRYGIRAGYDATLANLHNRFNAIRSVKSISRKAGQVQEVDVRCSVAIGNVEGVIARVQSVCVKW